MEEYSRFYDYLEDYGVQYVLDEFFYEREGETEDWGVLINPSMYQKALNEFIRFGHLDKFPSKYIYQWMGIIMKNTAILIANTELAGHSQGFPYDEVGETLMSYLNDGDYENGKFQIEGYDDILEVVDYETFYKDLDKFIIPDNLMERAKEILSNGNNDEEGLRWVVNLFNEYYDKSHYRKTLYNYTLDEQNRICKKHNMMDVLDEIGLYDWMKLPDGSDAWSDFGIDPILELISKYNENDSPEKVLVLINKILDVYHQRGDLSSIFIEGGSKSLSQISNGNVAEAIWKYKLKNIIKEETIKFLKNG